MKTDLHIHSNYSSDGKATPEEIIIQAVARGINVLAITDHADFAIGDSCFVQENYLAHLKPLSDRQSDLTLLCGVELGIQAEHATRCASFINGHDFDFVIGSMHRARELDFYNGEFFRDLSADQCWEIYLNETIRAVKTCSNFDVIGHLNIISRYNITRNTNPPSALAPLLDELLKWLVSNGKGIEINTSGLRYGLDSVHPTPELIRRFRELGGEIVTIGSDSHNTATLGQDFSLAIDILKSCGFKHHTWFKNRVAQFADL